MLFGNFRNNRTTLKLINLFKSPTSFKTVTQITLLHKMGSPTTAGNGAGSHRTPEELTKIREKPFIVICGCTGTGKTKLSIQLAEWLIKNNRQAEIINADAMQVFTSECVVYIYNDIILINFDFVLALQELGCDHQQGD